MLRRMTALVALAYLGLSACSDIRLAPAMNLGQGQGGAAPVPQGAPAPKSPTGERIAHANGWSLVVPQGYYYKVTATGFIVSDQSLRPVFKDSGPSGGGPPRLVRRPITIKIDFSERGPAAACRQSRTAGGVRYCYHVALLDGPTGSGGAEYRITGQGQRDGVHIRFISQKQYEDVAPAAMFRTVWALLASLRSPSP